MTPADAEKLIAQHLQCLPIESLPLARNSDDFVFDNQMLVQVIAFGMRVGEISCPTRYFADASEINFRRSVVYGFGVLLNGVLYRAWKWKLARPQLFANDAASRLQPSGAAASTSRAC